MASIRRLQGLHETEEFKNSCKRCRMQTRVRYEYADTPEQKRAIRILANLLMASQQRVNGKGKSKEQNEPLDRIHRDGRSSLDSSSYAVYTKGDLA